jgi:hypothetical protein
VIFLRDHYLKIVRKIELELEEAIEDVKECKVDARDFEDFDKKYVQQLVWQLPKLEKSPTKRETLQYFVGAQFALENILRFVKDLDFKDKIKVIDSDKDKYIKKLEGIVKSNEINIRNLNKMNEAKIKEKDDEIKKIEKEKEELIVIINKLEKKIMKYKSKKNDLIILNPKKDKRG